MTKPYLLGMLHDATERKTTYRIATKNRDFCEFLARGIRELGSGAWIYNEGKRRNLWVVEFPKSLICGMKIKSRQDKIEYVRGYFDAEGGIAKDSDVRYYLYFAQKDKKDLLQVRGYLKELGIFCGRVHNPSKTIDPHYFRFFIRARSYGDFARIVSSDHPDKRRFLRMKI